MPFQPNKPTASKRWMHRRHNNKEHNKKSVCVFFFCSLCMISVLADLDQICRVAFSYPPDGHEGIIAMQRDCMIPPTMVASPYAVGWLALVLWWGAKKLYKFKSRYRRNRSETASSSLFSDTRGSFWWNLFHFIWSSYVGICCIELCRTFLAHPVLLLPSALLKAKPKVLLWMCGIKLRDISM